MASFKKIIDHDIVCRKGEKFEIYRVWMCAGGIAQWGSLLDMAQQDVGKNLQVQRELARIYKMAVINQDQQTLQLIKDADQDRRLSQKEWQTIQASHSEILKNFDHSDAMAREKEFLQRKAAQQAL